MLQVRMPIQLIQAFLVFTILFVAEAVLANSSSMSWYTGGEGKLSIKPISIDSSASAVFEGVTTLKTLVVTVAKKGGRKRTNPIPLAADGSFNVRYLFKDGVGSYTISFFGSKESHSQNYQGLGFITLAVNKMPSAADLLGLELNSKVIEYVDKVMGTTVGRGECWDLVQNALDINLADWDRPVAFGQPVNSESNDIKAGDIIQFRKLRTIEHLSGGVTKRETFGSPDHTAVIYKVLGKKHYTLAHQNVSGKRIVMKGNVNLANVSGGNYWIYRPVALMIQQ